MKTQRLLVFLALSLLLAGCTDLYISNLTEINARFSVTTPDSGSAISKLIQPYHVDSFFSSSGGVFRVQMLPDEGFRDLLNDLQSHFTERLFNEGASLSVEEVTLLTHRLNEIDTLIEQLGNETLPSCTVRIADFESATIFLNYDPVTQTYSLQCQ